MEGLGKLPDIELLNGTVAMRERHTRPELVFWFDMPPRASAGVFSHVAQEWGNKVFYMCVNPLAEERKAAGWVDCDHGDAVVTILSEQERPDQFLGEFFREHNDVIHVCNGFRSLTLPYLKRHVFSLPDARIAVMSERPNLYGSQLKKLALRFLHRLLAVRYARKTQVYFAHGAIGVKTYAQLGWNPSILFPIMYASQVPSDLPNILPRTAGGFLRLLYVGRFARSTKGVDVLIHAADGLRGDNWHLDLVGGYGEFKDDTIEWAEKHPNVSFCGTWPSDEISRRVTQYDVCVVPSRYDGWNVVANEAICAGIGLIITDAAGSDDLVRTSGAGTIVPAGDANALRQAIQQVIDDPSIANTWKEKALAYSPRIRPECVGRYFVDVLEYSFLKNTGARPECPWL